MNIHLDIQTLQDLKALLQKLSFHVEQTTIEKIFQQYKTIVDNHSYRYPNNKLLQECKSEHEKLKTLLTDKQAGDVKMMLEKTVNKALLALTDEKDQL